MPRHPSTSDYNGCRTPAIPRPRGAGNRARSPVASTRVDQTPVGDRRSRGRGRRARRSRPEPCDSALVRGWSRRPRPRRRPRPPRRPRRHHPPLPPRRPPPPATVEATCENTSTAEFRAMMATNGWVSWETQDQQIGARPFDALPERRARGRDRLPLGRRPEPRDRQRHRPRVVAHRPRERGRRDDEARVRTGLHAHRGTRGHLPRDAGAEGGRATPKAGEPTYLFGFDDVRWAATKADVTDYVKAPTEAELIARVESAP